MNFSVAEIQFRDLLLGLRRTQIGLRFLIGVCPCVGLAYGQNAGRDQLLRPLVLVPGKVDPGLCRTHPGFCPGKIGKEGFRIDADQKVAGPHQTAFAEMNGLDLTCHARPDFDPFDGFKAAGKFLPANQILLKNGRDPPLTIAATVTPANMNLYPRPVLFVPAIGSLHPQICTDWYEIVGHIWLVDIRCSTPHLTDQYKKIIGGD